MARKGWPVTLSIGAVTFLRPPPDVDFMIRRVDGLMYAAKRNGRGRIEHAVIADDLSYDEEQQQWMEKRATARVLCDRRARILYKVPSDDPTEFALVRDISAAGICLHLDRQYPVGALLIVESLSPGGRALLARVLRAEPDDGRWKHGCELSTQFKRRGTPLLAWRPSNRFIGWVSPVRNPPYALEAHTNFVTPGIATGGVGIGAELVLAPASGLPWSSAPCSQVMTWPV